jgi:diaminopimelate decarboxylase
VARQRFSRRSSESFDAAALGAAKSFQTGIPAHEGLPVKIPTFVTTEISDWDLHAFCREHDWKVWLKGPYYEAVKVEAGRNSKRCATFFRAPGRPKGFFAIARFRLRRISHLSAYQGELLTASRCASAI